MLTGLWVWQTQNSIRQQWIFIWRKESENGFTVHQCDIKAYCQAFRTVSLSNLHGCLIKFWIFLCNKRICCIGKLRIQLGNHEKTGSGSLLPTKCYSSCRYATATTLRRLQVLEVDTIHIIVHLHVVVGELSQKVGYVWICKILKRIESVRGFVVTIVCNFLLRTPDKIRQNSVKYSSAVI